MKRKIKLSFKTLEKELSLISSDIMTNIYGGSGDDPFIYGQNGYCSFNSMAYLNYVMNGNNSNYYCDYFDQYIDQYGDSQVSRDQNGNIIGISTNNNDQYFDSFFDSIYDNYQVSPTQKSTLDNAIDNGYMAVVDYGGHSYVIRGRDEDTGSYRLIDTSESQGGFFNTAWVKIENLSHIKVVTGAKIQTTEYSNSTTTSSSGNIETPFGGEGTSTTTDYYGTTSYTTEY